MFTHTFIEKKLKQIISELEGNLAAVGSNLSDLKTLVENMSAAEAAAGKKSLGEKTSVSVAKSEPNNIPTEEELNNMPLVDLRALGKKLGVESGGKRPEIVANILALADDETEPPKTLEKKSESAAPAKNGLKSLKPKTKEPEPEETNEGEEEISERDRQIMTALNEMKDSELKDLLKGAGLSATGKRTVLIDKVFAAVKEDKIEFCTEDNQEEAQEEEQEEEQVWYIRDEFPQFVVNDSAAKLTKERRAKLDEMEELFKAEGTGEKEDDIDKTLQMFFGKKFKVKDYDLKQKERLYLEILQLYVNDAGEEVEEGEAYELNGKYYCCGNPLDKDYKCAVCGAEYAEG